MSLLDYGDADNPYSGLGDGAGDLLARIRALPTDQLQRLFQAQPDGGMSLLNAITSRGDAAYRRLADLFTNPRESIAQMTAPGPEDRAYQRALEASQSVMPEVAAQGKAERKALVEPLARDAALAGLTVYHGSPHFFRKFDFTGNLGQGQGAASYGRGGYLADAPQVTEEYANMRKGQVIPDRGLSPDTALNVRAAFDATKGRDYDPKLAAEYAAEHVPVFRRAWMSRGMTEDDPLVQAAVQPWHDAHDAIVQGRYSIGSPNYYKVDLPDRNIRQMMQYDLPLSQQPAGVKKFVRDFTDMQPTDRSEPMGAAFQIARKAGDPEINMLEAGIPGIRYLDQLSRPAPVMRAELERYRNMLGDLRRYAQMGGAAGDSAMARMPEVQRKIDMLEALMPTGAPTYNTVLFDDSLANIIGHQTTPFGG